MEEFSPKAQFKDVRVKNTFDEERFKQVLDETPFWIANIFDDVDDVCYTREKLYKDILNGLITGYARNVATFNSHQSAYILCYLLVCLYILNEFTKTRRAKVMTHKQPLIDRELKKLMNKRYKALLQ